MSETVETVDASKFRIFESGNLDSLLVPQKASDIEAFKKVNKVFEQSCKSLSSRKRCNGTCWDAEAHKSQWMDVFLENSD